MVEVAPLALANRSLLEGDTEPVQVAQDPCFRPFLVPGGVRVVDPQDENTVLLIREVPVRDGC